MRVGKVVGTVVSTQKADELVGGKLLLVQEYTVNYEPTDTYLVAFDTVGAGEGETVLTVQGSSARLTAATRDRPVDAAVVAIIDTVEYDGRTTFDRTRD